MGLISSIASVVNPESGKATARAYLAELDATGNVRSGGGAALRFVTFNSFSSFATAKANFTGSLMPAISFAFFGFLPSA